MLTIRKRLQWPYQRDEGVVVLFYIAIHNQTYNLIEILIKRYYHKIVHMISPLSIFYQIKSMAQWLSLLLCWWRAGG